MAKPRGRPRKKTDPDEEGPYKVPEGQPENYCEYCGELIVNTRRKGFCSDTCKYEHKRGKIHPNRQAGKWSADAAKAPDQQTPHPSETQPEVDPVATGGKVVSLSSLEAEEARKMGIDPAVLEVSEQKHPTLLVEDEEESFVSLADDTSDPEKTYEAILSDKRVWIPGQSWLDVMIYRGDFDDDFDGDFESSRWTPALPRIWDRLPIAELKARLIREHGGGVFQVKFLRAGLAAPKKASAPLILRIEGESMYSKPTQVDANALLLEKERQAERARQEVLRLQQEKAESQMQATDKVFELQKKMLEQAEAKEARMSEQIDKLRETRENPASLSLLEKQMELLREEKKFLIMQMEELRRESQEKDQNLFQWMLKQQEKQEEARIQEQMRQAESQQKLAQILSERDNHFLDAIREMRGNNNGNFDMVQFMAMQQQQQQKTQEFYLQQQAEERRRMEEINRQSRQDLLLMFEKISEGKQQSGQDPFISYILTQQHQAQTQLEQQRLEYARLMERMVDQSKKDQAVNSLQSFVETAKTFSQAKDVISTTLGLAPAQTPVVEARKPPENKVGDFFGKLQDVAKAFGVEKLTEAISSRIQQGGKTATTPQVATAIRAPNVVPLADQRPFVPQQFYQTPMIQQPMPQGYPPQPVQQFAALQPIQQFVQQPAVPQPVPMQQQQGTPPIVPTAQPVEPSNGNGNGDGSISDRARQLVQVVDEAIRNNVPASQIVSSLPEETITMIRQLGKDEFVSTVQSFSSSDLVKSVRGANWLESARDLLYTN